MHHPNRHIIQSKISRSRTQYNQHQHKHKHQHHHDKSKFHNRFPLFMKDDDDSASASASTTYDDENIKITKRKVVLTKPMGLLLEEDTERAPGVVTIAQIDPNGNTARRSKEGTADICIGDIILEVDGQDCFYNNTKRDLKQVMDLIAQTSEPEVSMTLGRLESKVRIQFSNGIHVTANTGDNLGALAALAMVRITYSCDSGGCGTCEQVMRIKKKDTEEWDQRYVRPCVARIPKGAEVIALYPSDRFEPLD